ncbi:MAG: hypothetical protein M3Q95_11425 [Bacteroidota bacterium]|nr:hypothetical protein [Bacteroidota bacterium]
MNKFKTIDELRSVKRRLYFKKEELESDMNTNVENIKELFTPSGIFHKLTGTERKDNHLENGATHKETTGAPGVIDGMAATFIDLVVNNIFFKRSSYVKKFAISYLVRLVGPTLLHTATPVIKNFIKKSGIIDNFSKKEAVNHPQ